MRYLNHRLKRGTLLTLVLAVFVTLKTVSCAKRDGVREWQV